MLQAFPDMVSFWRPEGAAAGGVGREWDSRWPISGQIEIPLASRAIRVTTRQIASDDDTERPEATTACAPYDAPKRPSAMPTAGRQVAYAGPNAQIGADSKAA